MPDSPRHHDTASGGAVSSLFCVSRARVLSASWPVRSAAAVRMRSSLVRLARVSRNSAVPARPCARPAAGSKPAAGAVSSRKGEAEAVPPMMSWAHRRARSRWAGSPDWYSQRWPRPAPAVPMRRSSPSAAAVVLRELRSSGTAIPLAAASCKKMLTPVLPVNRPGGSFACCAALMLNLASPSSTRAVRTVPV